MCDLPGLLLPTRSFLYDLGTCLFVCDYYVTSFLVYVYLLCLLGCCCQLCRERRWNMQNVVLRVHAWWPVMILIVILILLIITTLVILSIVVLHNNNNNNNNINHTKSLTLTLTILPLLLLLLIIIIIIIAITMQNVVLRVDAWRPAFLCHIGATRRDPTPRSQI